MKCFEASFHRFDKSEGLGERHPPPPHLQHDAGMMGFTKLATHLARRRGGEEARRRGGEEARRRGGEEARRRGGEEARRRGREERG